MKKLFLLPMFLLALLITGCLNSNNDKLFDKRLKCDSLKKQIEEDIIDKQSNSAFVNNNGEGDSAIYYTLDEVFYSPQRKSCLYVIEMEYSKESSLKKTYELYDYFAKSYIANCNYGIDNKNNYMTKEFWQIVKELKKSKD